MTKITTLKKRIYYLFFIVVLGLFLALIYHGTLNYLGYNYPENTFLFSPEDRFNDFHNSVLSTASSNPYFSNSPATSTYFPFSYWIFSIFTNNSRDINTALYLIISISMLIGSIYCSWYFLFYQKFLINEKFSSSFLLLLGALVFCYPTIFSLDRGNLDLWIASLCIFYIALLQTNFSWIGYICLSIAIMFKGYPAAFLLLSISQKKYLSSFLCLAGSILLTILIMTILWGGFSMNRHGLELGLSKYYKIYVIGGNSLFASSDPYNGIRTLVLILNNSIDIIPKHVSLDDWSISLLKIYSPFSFALAFIASCFVLLSRGLMWTKTVAISLIILLFPNVAGDYKLCILFPATLVLLAYESPFKKTEKIALIIFGLLLIPKSYIFIHSYGLSNIINPLLIILLSCLTFLNPFQWHGVRSVRYFLGR